MNYRFVAARDESSQVISASDPSTPLERTDHQIGRWRRQAFFAAASLIATCSYCPSIASAQDAAQDNTAQPVPERPKIRADRRSEEDWSVLADPRVAREPLDGLKYIPLDTAHPKMYLSLGVNLRERFELDHATFFGAASGESGQWILSRLEWHADLRLGNHVQLFTQFQNAVAPGKARLKPVDQDRLDVEQAFIGLTEPLGGGTLRLRLGDRSLPSSSRDLRRFARARICVSPMTRRSRTTRAAGGTSSVPMSNRFRLRTYTRLTTTAITT